MNNNNTTGVKKMNNNINENNENVENLYKKYPAIRHIQPDIYIIDRYNIVSRLTAIEYYREFEYVICQLADESDSEKQDDLVSYINLTDTLDVSSMFNWSDTYSISNTPPSKSYWRQVQKYIQINNALDIIYRLKIIELHNLHLMKIECINLQEVKDTIKQYTTDKDKITTIVTGIDALAFMQETNEDEDE